MHTTEQLNTALAGRYAIERKVGEGGMATVYLARDLRHSRPVALKVLKPDLGAVVGVDRFLAEIQVTANLQHPNLLPLFDSGAADGLLYYVMPYVDGESLRERLQREKQLPIEDALHIATAVASALDYAHRHGVIHRDLKPENILLLEGQPLVADFGIALAVSNAGGNRITQTGLSLGTPQYMSPEQATGDRAIDGRTDIYSLGAVLYEMLTGEAPHTGSTSQAIIARVLTEKPRQVRASRPHVPAHVEAAVEHALEKLPADRWATAKEFAEAVTGARPFTAAAASPARSASPQTKPWDRRSAALLAAVLVLTAALAASITRGARVASRTPVVYDVGLPDSAPISFTGGSPWGEGWTALAVGPSGDFAVYVAQRGPGTELWYRSLVDTVARPLTGTAGAYLPMLSPDGRQVAYFTGKQLMVSPISGGAPAKVGEVDRPHGGEWTDANRIIVSDSNGFHLRAFDPVVHTSQLLARSSPTTCPMPALLASNALLCSPRTAQSRNLGTLNGAFRAFRVGTPGNDTAGALLAGTHFRLVDRSHLVFIAYDGTLSAVTIDRTTQQAGRPVSLVAGVRREGFDAPGQYALSASGALVFVPGDNAEVGRFARLKEGAAAQELALPPAAYHRFDVTKDGRRLTSTVTAVDGTQELWVYDLTTGQGEKWLRGYYIGEPRWDPSGTRIVVQMIGSERGAWVTILGSPGSTAPLDTILPAGKSFNVFAFVSDTLLLGVLADDGRMTPVRLNLRKRPAYVTPISASAYFSHALSPDGRWLAYATGSTGGWEVFVERFPADGHRYRVSPNGGLEPLWRGPGRLVFRSSATWYEVNVGTSPTAPVGEPRAIVSDPRFIDTFGRSNVLLPDGSLVYVRGTKQTTGSYLRVIPRFADEIRRRVK